MRGRGLLAVAALAVAAAAFLLLESGAVRVSRAEDSAAVRLLEPRATHTRPGLPPIVPQPKPNMPGDGVTRVKGVVSGPDGSIWGVKVLIKSADPEHKEPLGETYTGASGGYEFILDFAALPSSEVFVVAEPDELTHLNPTKTDPFVILREHTTEVDVGVGGVHRIRGNVRRSDGRRIPAGLDICAVPIDQLENQPSVVHGAGPRATPFPTDEDQPSSRVRPNGDFSVSVGRDANYILYCRSTEFFLDCDPARPGVPLNALLRPACGVEGQVWDVADVLRPAPRTKGRYLGGLPIQIRFESKSGETFRGHGRTDKGFVALKWPRPAWWRSGTDVTVFVESIGETANAFSIRQTVYKGLFGASLQLYVVPRGETVRSFSFRIRIGGKEWQPDGVLRAHFVPISAAGVRKCLLFADPDGVRRIVVPPAAGRVVFVYRMLPLLAHELGPEEELPDRVFELPAFGKIVLKRPKGAWSNSKIVRIVRKFDEDSGHDVRALGRETIFPAVVPGVWIVTIDEKTKHEVEVRAGEITEIVVGSNK